jgi:HK97 family phage major capsid protein
METKTIEMDAELQKAIVEETTKALEPQMAKMAEDAAKAAADAVFAKFDKPAKKAIGTDSDEEIDGAGGEEAGSPAMLKRFYGGDAGLVESFPAIASLAIRDLSGLNVKLAEMSKERRLFLGVKALIEKDQETIKTLNTFAGEMFALKGYQDGRFSNLAEKAGYANDAISADGGALVPDPEFNTTIYENLPKYGVIFRDGNVQNTDRTAVYALSLTGTIAFTNVAEAGAISGSKLKFNRSQTSLLKYATIVPATTELTEDSIIDYWAIVTNEVSRAYGLAADSLVFTDTTYGIMHTAGVITQPLISAGAGTTITWDDLLMAEGKTEDALDTSDYVWYMRKETFFRLAQVKASTSGVYLSSDMLAGWSANPNTPTTPWGTAVHFVRVLPKSTEVSANGGLALYGTLKNTNFYNKNGLALTMLTEATVTDANGSSFNLATQDGLALRVTVRFLHILPAGNASKYVLVGTGTVS